MIATITPLQEAVEQQLLDSSSVHPRSGQTIDELCTKVLSEMASIYRQSHNPDTMAQDINQCYVSISLMLDMFVRAYSVHKDILSSNESAKCNYCESKVEHGVTLQVEHFRPKAKIDPIDNNGVEHPGYFWLGLEWTNLLLSCPKCNGKGAKGNRFPIRGPRAVPFHPVDATTGILNRSECYINQPALIAEDPLLLNPEIDHPDRYLTFDTNGHILSRGPDSLRADTSIAIYRLNRDLLVASRIDVINKFTQRININTAAHIIGEINEETLKFNFKTIAREIIARQSPYEEYTLWGIHFNTEIESCFISHLNSPYDALFRQAYNDLV